MIQGWHNDDYLILFEDHDEAAKMSEQYSITASLPNYMLIGFRSWDDFIIRNAKNEFFSVPTVPLDIRYVQPFVLEVDPSKLVSDPRLAGKIKWYVKPLVFGGDASADGNISWITIDEHVKAVNWWNQLYRDLQRKKQSTPPPPQT